MLDVSFVLLLFLPPVEFYGFAFHLPPFFDFSFLPRRAKLGATDISLAGT